MFDFDLFYDKFWAYYPSDLCHGKKGSKPGGKAAAKRKVKSQEEADRIMLNTEAWAKYSRHELKTNDYTDRWPHVSKYFNQEYYDMDIPSYTQAETAQEAIVKTCIHCTNPVHGPSYDVCTSHITAVKIEHEPRVVGNARVHLKTIKGVLK